MNTNRNGWTGYLLALGISAGTVGLRVFVLRGNVPEHAHLLPALASVMAAAYFAGVGPALMATAVEVFMAVPLLGLEPWASADNACETGIVAACGAVVSIVLGRLRAARAEAGAVARECRLARALIAHGSDVTVVVDAAGQSMFVSPSSAHVTGHTPEDFRGRTPFDLMPEGDAAAMRQVFERLLGTPGLTLRVEHRYIHKDGSVRWLEGTVTNLLHDPAVGGVVGNFRDVTDRKRFEQDLRRAKEAAEAANREKDRFLAVLSHELRTPLTPVLTTVQTLEGDAVVPAALRESLSMIRRNVELEARLIDDLLDLTRVARGKLVLALQPVDAHSKLRCVFEMCDAERRGKQIDLRLDLAAAEGWVSSDPARLQQVLWNVLKNAIKFTPVGGWIIVRTSNPAPGRLRVEVADNGIGIEPEHLGRIFDAFEQGNESARRFGGLGLGLAISKALVELNGGTIEADSPGMGRGSTFAIELATVKAPVVDPPHAEAPAGPARDLSILLVEDHEDTARAVASLLRRCGWSVRVADTVASAMQVADAEEFDLLISDIGLPDGTGLDLMRQLLARKPVRGICMSGFGMEEDVRRSRAAGFLEHLTKPVNVTQLKKAILRSTAEEVGV